MSEAGYSEVTIGPGFPPSWWDDHGPKGNCPGCGGECDGDDCGLHAAGCVFGGFGLLYWLVADGCPLWHGATTPVSDDTEPGVTPEGGELR